MAISNRAAKKIKAGIGGRVREKNDEGMVHGVPLYRAPSKPKAATVKPTYNRKTGKMTYR